MRKIVFANGEIYHIVNRGVAQAPIFKDRREYSRALLAINYYRFSGIPFKLSKALALESSEKYIFFKKLNESKKVRVKIICFCLMPNHFHFLLTQTEENGIKNFISNFSLSYAKYFNMRNHRIGPLVQGVFKAIRIESDEQLTHVSRYIHLNPVSSFLIPEKELIIYPWSSFLEYLGVSTTNICSKELILNMFPSTKKYLEFVHDQIDYAKRLEKIKHLCLE